MAVNNKEDIKPIIKKEVKEIDEKAENIEISDFEKKDNYWIVNVQFDIGEDNKRYLFHIQSEDGAVIKRQDKTAFGRVI